MVTVRRDIDVPAGTVWAVLADGWLYPSWVVGASRMREVDPAWPGVGAQLHHSVGTWPMLLNDTTTVLASVPMRELVLRARGWPMGEAEIRVTLEDRAQ
ncbi:MAG TPA: SRPBCC family protein, partial [Pseudonocardia sp.]|nr:SRPBCC family protein [Pseudonocardia sp.]